MTVTTRRYGTRKENVSTPPARTVKRLLRERGRSIADVARRAGVNRSIASRVVNKKPVFCSNATKARVWRKLAELTK